MVFTRIELIYIYIIYDFRTIIVGLRGYLLLIDHSGDEVCFVKKNAKNCCDCQSPHHCIVRLFIMGDRLLLLHRKAGGSAA